jgi:hypothetical protein
MVTEETAMMGMGMVKKIARAMNAITTSDPLIAKLVLPIFALLVLMLV